MRGDAQAIATDRRELLSMSQIMRVKGDLQATRTPANVPAAKQFYDQSLVFARERKAMSLELQLQCSYFINHIDRRRIAAR